jgi:hypothetical protein
MCLEDKHAAYKPIEAKFGFYKILNYCTALIFVLQQRDWKGLDADSSSSKEVTQFPNLFDCATPSAQDCMKIIRKFP